MTSGASLLMVEQKPAVLIGYVGNVDYEMMKAVEEGLEEEGIPCEVQFLSVAGGSVQSHGQMKPAMQIANELAQKSRINVGLVVSAHENTALLHHRDLPVEQPLMCLDDHKITVYTLQILGRNAARLVKGDPFILV